MRRARKCKHKICAGRDIARVELCCRALREAAGTSEAWVALVVREMERPAPEGGPAAARLAYAARARAYGEECALEATRAVEAVGRRRLLRARLCVACAAHTLSLLASVAAPVLLFFVWLLLLALKLDGIVVVGWYRVFCVLAAAPACALADGVLGAGVQLVRVATWGDGNSNACGRAKCTGWWGALWRENAVEGRTGAMAAKVVFYGVSLGLLTAWFLLIGTKLEGDFHAPWAVVCAPLWLLFVMSFCALPCAAANTHDDDEPIYHPALLAAGAAGACGFSVYFLSFAVCVVVWADGAGFALNRAFVPLWVFDAFFVAGSVVVAVSWALHKFRLAGRRASCVWRVMVACGRVLLALACMWGLFALVALTPILLVLNIEGLVAISWRSVLAPALVTTACAAVAAAALSVVWVVAELRGARWLETVDAEQALGIVRRSEWGNVNAVV